MEPDDLRRAVRACSACGLRLTCSAPVPPTIHLPDDPDTPRLVLLGQAPGRHEDQWGRPFVGPAGRLLDECCTLARLPAHSRANPVCCWPPGDREPTAGELAACRPNLIATLSTLRPRPHQDGGIGLVVVLLGRVALSVVNPSARGVGEARGRPWWSETPWPGAYLATWHPAYVLRQPSAREELIVDLRMAAAIVSGWWPETCECGGTVAVYDGRGCPWCERCAMTQPTLAMQLPSARRRVRLPRGGGAGGADSLPCARCRRPAAMRVDLDGREYDLCSRCHWRLSKYAPSG